MFGIASIVFLALALIMNLWGLAKGHLTWQALALAGLLCLAIHLVAGPGWPRRKT